MKKIFQIILLVTIMVIAAMEISAQTTFYLSATQLPGETPAFNAGWNVTTSAARRRMRTTKDASTITSATTGQIGGSAVRKALMRQFISVPLAAQTINGTLTGQVRFNLSSTTSTTGQGFVYFRIINENGTIAQEVGTLTTTNLTTTLTNRTLIALTLSSVVITNGQRFCIDVGWNESVGTTTTITGTGSFGTSSATDLPVNNTTTTANTPWVRFSQTILFQNGAKFFF